MQKPPNIPRRSTTERPHGEEHQSNSHKTFLVLTGGESATYLNRVIEIARAKLGKNLSSVILFGGLARGEFSAAVSDVDLILVVSDDTASDAMTDLGSAIERLQDKQGPLHDRSHFLHVFTRRSALFKSHFVIRRKTLLSQAPKLLFKEARGFDFPFGRVLVHLVPAELVIRNILGGAIIVYGENVLGTLQLPIPPASTPAKTLIVSELVAIFAAVSSLFFRDGTMFSLESLKWFLLDMHSYSSTEQSNLDHATSHEKAIDSLAVLPILGQFVSLRMHYRRSIGLAFSLPFYLVLSFLARGKVVWAAFTSRSVSSSL